MKNYVIISEFNPFHKGHKYLIEQCKKNGATHITCIMSGNFVQRGDVAIISKHLRVETALHNGVDLLLELPLPFAISNAQVFARGGVEIANAMGCTDFLAFGSECGNIEILSHISDMISSVDFTQYMKNEISKGLSYPTALSNTMKHFNNSFYNVISEPNNVLGIEYIKALKELNSNIIPMTFKRFGDFHNSNEISSEFASASNIRNLIFKNKDFKNYVTESSYIILCRAIANGEIANIKNNMRGILSKLRSMSISEISDIVDVNEGLEYRIEKAISKSVSLNEIIETIKSKRYTYARIRRILLSAFLDIKKTFYTKPVPYLRILGFNKNGAEILKLMKKKATLPIVTKLTNKPENFSDFANKMLDLEIKSTDIYYTFTENINPCGKEFKNGIIIK